MANLLDKIYGCIAASRIGSSMGTLTEGWSVARIKEVYGVVQGLAGKPADFIQFIKFGRENSGAHR